MLSPEVRNLSMMGENLTTRLCLFLSISPSHWTVMHTAAFLIVYCPDWAAAVRVDSEALPHVDYHIRATPPDDRCMMPD